MAVCHKKTQLGNFTALMVFFPLLDAFLQVYSLVLANYSLQLDSWSSS